MPHLHRWPIRLFVIEVVAVARAPAAAVSRTLARGEATGVGSSKLRGLGLELCQKAVQRCTLFPLSRCLGPGPATPLLQGSGLAWQRARWPSRRPQVIQHSTAIQMARYWGSLGLQRGLLLSSPSSPGLLQQLLGFQPVALEEVGQLLELLLHAPFARDNPDDLPGRGEDDRRRLGHGRRSSARPGAPRRRALCPAEAPPGAEVAAVPGCSPPP